MLCLNISDTAIIAVRNVNYICFFYEISKSEVMHLLKILCLNIVGIYKIYVNINLEIGICNYSNILTKSEKLETEIKDLVMYFTRYINYNSIKRLSLYHHELIGHIEEHEKKVLND